MVLDSSVIVAIHCREPGHDLLIDKIAKADILVVGAPTLLESAMLLTSRLGPDARSILSSFLRRTETEVAPFTAEHFEAAVTAFLRFGRGRHPAALNFGDCLSYAVASVAGLPLLFTGNDFARTDIPAA